MAADRTPFAIVALESGTALVLPDSAFTERQRAAIAHIVQHRGVDALPAAPEPILAAHELPQASPTDRVALAGAARAKGYTGEFCPQCQSPNTRRNGSCLVCDNCGSTTGCS